MSTFKLPNRTWYALLVAIVLLAIPHVEGLPWWTFTSSVVVAVWIVGHIRWQFRPLPTYIRVIVAFVTLGLVLNHYRSIHTLDVYIALLMMFHGQKVLEMNSAKDLYFAVFIGLIAAITRLLYVQAFSDMFLAIITAVVLLFVLYSRYVRQSISFWAAIRNILMLLLKASPLVVALFFLFPRIPPLMVIPELGQSGKTGVSGVVEPGNITELARSREPAFRVEFEGDIPSASSLYWRGVVLDRFDGKRWTASPRRTVDRDWLPTSTMNASDALRYRVAMEPSNQHWLFTLPVSRPANEAAVSVNGFLVASKEPVAKQKTYVFERYITPLREAMAPGQQRLMMMLPVTSNPKSQTLGRDLAEQYDDPAAIVQALARRFKASFRYSLNSPILGEHSADEFLFETQVGYCEHFSHAAAVVMRAAGIPTRLVGGYLGGEVNPFQDYILVRQQDAHVWLEYWQSDTGWVRFDPTAAVAPERIDRGSEATLTDRNELDATFSSSGQFGMFYDLYLWADAMNYGWARWLDEYNSQNQVGMLENLTGFKNLKDHLVSILVVVAILVTLPFGILAVWAALRIRVPLGVSVLLADQALKVAGLARPQQTTPRQWQSKNPILPRSYRRLVKLWYRVWFNEDALGFGGYVQLSLLLPRLWGWAVFYHLSSGPKRRRNSRAAKAV